MITQLYHPYLLPLGITYPQYLVFLLLWEEDNRTVNDIGQCLFLESNTLSPLLKRLEEKKLIERVREKSDERKVKIHLTNLGKDLQEKCADIPFKIAQNFDYKEFKMSDLEFLKEGLNKMINQLKSPI
jgi:DNA-binding MarR family transcriptional regulator